MGGPADHQQVVVRRAHIHHHLALPADGHQQAPISEVERAHPEHLAVRELHAADLIECELQAPLLDHLQTVVLELLAEILIEALGALVDLALGVGDLGDVTFTLNRRSA